MEKYDQSWCPTETAIAMIGNRWRVLIIRELLGGTRRFSELKKALDGVTQKVLTSNLRAMEESGLLTRTVYPEVPPRVEYTLTDLGRSLAPVMEALHEWGKTYKSLHGGCHCAQCEDTGCSCCRMCEKAAGNV